MNLIPEDRVEPVSHDVGVLQLVDQLKAVQTVDDLQELTRALSLDAAVNDPSFISDANVHGVPANLGMTFRQRFRDLAVILSDLSARYEVGFHKAIPPEDKRALGYLAKYVSKCVVPLAA